ncbi:hypothetical protein [Streptomyces sp. NPDC001933]|uniref:hypothetical protein n=1 Tax=Streptomyces sp. NPDC001933 TaxID=3364626 RepID=UPI0036959102
MTTPTDVFGVNDALLGAFPAQPSEIRRASIRVYTGGQGLDRRLDALTEARCLRVVRVFAALARGRVGGLSAVVSEQVLRAARDMLPSLESSIGSVAKLLGVSVGTVCIRIRGLKELRISNVPAQLVGGGR